MFNEIYKQLWRYNMSKGKEKRKSEDKKKPQKSLKEKRKAKKDKGSNIS